MPAWNSPGEEEGKGEDCSERSVAKSWRESKLQSAQLAPAVCSVLQALGDSYPQTASLEACSLHCTLWLLASRRQILNQ